MQNPSTPLVKTRQGTLSGTSEENIHIWRGIPYAAPPVGDLPLARAAACRPLAGRTPGGDFLGLQLAGY